MSDILCNGLIVYRCRQVNNCLTSVIKCIKCSKNMRIAYSQFAIVYVTVCRFGHGMVAMGNKVYVFGGAMNMDEEKVEYRNDLFVLTSENL